MTTSPDTTDLVVLWGDAKERRTLFKVLCATGATVRFVEKSDDFLAASERARLVMLDYDTLRDDVTRLLRELKHIERPPAVLVLTASRDKADLIELFGHDVLTNMVAKNIAFDATEIIVTVQKILTGDIFGIDKYLTWGVRPHCQVLHSSSEKDHVLQVLDDYLQRLASNKRLNTLAKSVSDELLMNAIYNAPLDEAGNGKYASLARSVPVQLADGEEVSFRYGFDGKMLALSVSDNFGRLERETVLRYLRKCFAQGVDQIDDKAGGAGLGLYYIFESLNHLIINVNPGKRTEMIGLMDISGSYRNFIDRPKSLNVFIDGTAK